MNVNDMQEDQEAVPCRLTAIFEKQRSLMHKYEIIEASNGLLQTCAIPVDLHSRTGQARLKDFAWRVTEEIGEATAAVEDRPENVVHFQEEIMDALHFMVELLILSGLGPMDITHLATKGEEKDSLDIIYNVHTDNLAFAKNLDSVAYPVIHSLSRAMNCLKNKPWKTTHMLTDVNKYRGYIIDSFLFLIELCIYAKMSPDDIFAMYTKKNKVNQFRQQSHY